LLLSELLENMTMVFALLKVMTVILAIWEAEMGEDCGSRSAGQKNNLRDPISLEKS
jgi:hypothetical protein